MAPFTLRRVALVISGAFVAGVAATVLQVAGVPTPYAVVVGLAGTMPVLLEGMRPTEATPDRGTRLQWALAEIVGALVVGLFVAFALVLAEVSIQWLVVGSTLGAYVGGFLARSAVVDDRVDDEDRVDD